MKKLLVVLLLTSSTAFAGAGEQLAAMDTAYRCLIPSAKKELKKSGLKDFDREIATKAAMNCLPSIRQYISECESGGNDYDACKNTADAILFRATEYAKGN
jgi:hypothetical protein